MKFVVFDHEGKGLHLHQALLNQGHTASPTLEDADLLLLDCDWEWAHPRPELIAAAHNLGIKVALYPHGGLPTTFIYDGLTQPDPLVSLRLEHGPGSLEIAELIRADHADDLNQEAVGWLYSPTLPYAPVEEPRRLLFAPMHPNIEALQKQINGHDPAPKMNQELYQQLLDLDMDLTVSVVAPPWRNGLYAHPKAKFIPNHEMDIHHSVRLIAQADVVVATGTIAAAAVALGKPTVMFGQGDFTDYIDGAYREADHASLYAGLCHYPYDADEADLGDLIQDACQWEAEEWRQRWVGEDGTVRAVGLLEELVGETSTGQKNVIIGGVTARATGT